MRRISDKTKRLPADWWIRVLGVVVIAAGVRLAFTDAPGKGASAAWSTADASARQALSGANDADVLAAAAGASDDVHKAAIAKRKDADAKRSAADATKTNLANAQSSIYWAWFGILAVIVLWFVAGVFGGDWNPLNLAMGADNRLSLSKLQILLWTATVGFVYAMVYADRLVTNPDATSLVGIPEYVLVVLGISATTTIAANAITGSQVASIPDSKANNGTPSYDPSALVQNDDGVTANLTKVQLLFWTIIAIAVYLFGAFNHLGQTAVCDVASSATCTLPDIDAALMVFMGLGHATYLGGKLVFSMQPMLTRLEIDGTPPDQIIMVAGNNLGSSAGTIKINGSVVPTAGVTWTDTTAFQFKLQPINPTTNAPWKSGDSVSVTVTVNGLTSVPATTTYP